MTIQSHTQFKDAATLNSEWVHGPHEGAALAHWSVGKDHVSYCRDDSHTISLYLKGGEAARRDGIPFKRGAPGSLCLMPAKEDSRWETGGAISFLHLYIPVSMLQAFAVEHLNKDARLVDLQPAAFTTDPKLQSLMARIWGQDFRTIDAEETLLSLQDHLLRIYCADRAKSAPPKGGLSGRQIKQLNEAIHNNLGGTLSIAYLASQVGMSRFHFARMFQLSFGESPAALVNRRRVDRVKRLLLQGRPLADCAAQAGFSHQSHMTTHFKKVTGTTPAVWRTRTYSK